MSDLRAMLVSALGERRVGNMVNLHAFEVEALIEALTPQPRIVGASPAYGTAASGGTIYETGLVVPHPAPPKPKRKPRAESDS